MHEFYPQLVQKWTVLMLLFVCKDPAVSHICALKPTSLSISLLKTTSMCVRSQERHALQGQHTPAHTY